MQAGLGRHLCSTGRSNDSSSTYQPRRKASCNTIQQYITPMRSIISYVRLLANSKAAYSGAHWITARQSPPGNNHALFRLKPESEGLLCSFSPAPEIFSLPPHMSLMACGKNRGSIAAVLPYCGVKSLGRQPRLTKK